jgi:DNA excision repair protein ERCC-2
MKFNVENVPVYFPYPFVYEEQLAYMRALKRAVERKGEKRLFCSSCCCCGHPSHIHPGSHCMLEMPTGTGKTVTLLSFVTSYQQHCAETGEPVPKLVYCTRTVQEMEKVLKELKEVTKYRLSECGKAECDILAIGLSSRRNLCVHETISRGDRNAVDAGKQASCINTLVEKQQPTQFSRNTAISLPQCHSLVGSKLRARGCLRLQFLPEV